MSTPLLHTALIVDDNEIDRFIHKRLLLHYNICEEVIETKSGPEGLKKLKEMLGKNQTPDLILLDLMMVDMDGFEFLSHYQTLVPEMAKSPKLFMISSTEDEKDIKRTKESKHIIKLLRKPLVPDSLIESIKTHS